MKKNLTICFLLAISAYESWILVIAARRIIELEKAIWKNLKLEANPWEARNNLLKALNRWYEKKGSKLPDYLDK